MQTNMLLNRVLEIIESKNVTAVRFELMDMNGVAKSKIVPACHFKEKSTKGLNFCLIVILGSDILGGIVKESGFGKSIGFADAVTFPDFETFVILPWLNDTGRILIEPTYRGDLVSAHPRVAARMQLGRLHDRGMSLLTAYEYEFFLLDKVKMELVNTACSKFGSVMDTSVVELLDDFMQFLPQVGISVECIHSEFGPGGMEITYKPAFGIRAADDAHTFKTSVKEIALRRGYIASFNFQGVPTYVQCHINHSLWDTEGKIPLLFDASRTHNLSEVGHNWIAGILAHAPAIHTLMHPSTQPSKAAAIENYDPVNATWGLDNRTCLVRAKVSGEKETYLEARNAQAGVNPYVSLAAIVAAGLDGIDNKLPLPCPVTGSAYDDDNVPSHTADILSSTAEDALRALREDTVICDALGDPFIQCFSAHLIHNAAMENDDKWENNTDFQL